jgi:alkanesulfonate monooxygenase SsuD/methylene tetrahydromethanopterin reductase-like flavin-dependent oxidoreductase (luciferase family)
MSKVVKFGLFLGGNLEERVKIGVLAEKLGFDSVWAGHHFSFWYPNVEYPETFTTLLNIGLLTNKIVIGSCVIDPFSRHPALIAQTVASIDRVLKGRTILGLGCGEAMNTIPYGIKWSKPAYGLREAIQIIRGLLDSSFDKPYTFEGQTYNLKDAYIMIKPYSRLLPIYVSAASKLTKKIVGEMANGWLAHIHTPATFYEDLEDIRETARKSGRNPQDIDYAAFLIGVLGDDRRKCFQIVRDPVATELLLNKHISEKLLKNSGSDYLLEKIKEMHLGKFVATLPNVKYLWDLATNVPNHIIEELAFFGKPNDCLKLLEDFVKKGATHLIIFFASQKVDEQLRIFAKYIIPYFK